MPTLPSSLPFTLGGEVVVAAEIPPPGHVRDIFVDDTTGQWALDNGDLALVADAEAIAQDVKFRCSLVKGEWFLDEDAGLDWFGVVLVKNPNQVAVREEFRSAIAGATGVGSLTFLTTAIDELRRSLTVNYSAAADLTAFASEA